jgi:hypothetical protein
VLINRPIRPCPPFHAHAEASYVGRPFPLDEASEHWRRLRSWGLTSGELVISLSSRVIGTLCDKS